MLLAAGCCSKQQACFCTASITLGTKHSALPCVHARAAECTSYTFAPAHLAAFLPCSCLAQASAAARTGSGHPLLASRPATAIAAPCTAASSSKQPCAAKLATARAAGTAQGLSVDFISGPNACSTAEPAFATSAHAFECAVRLYTACAANFAAAQPGPRCSSGSRCCRQPEPSSCAWCCLVLLMCASACAASTQASFSAPCCSRCCSGGSALLALHRAKTASCEVHSTPHGCYAHPHTSTRKASNSRHCCRLL